MPGAGEPGALSALLGADLAARRGASQTFNASARRPRDRSTAVELKAGERRRRSEPRRLATRRRVSWPVVEIPLASDLGGAARRAPAARRGARRCAPAASRAAALPGPATWPASSTPARPPALPFKATAGLHHPVRGGARALTYEAGQPARRHARLPERVRWRPRFAWHGSPPRRSSRCSRSSDPRAFRFDETRSPGATGGSRRARSATRRANFAHAFGSCSFEEPVARPASAGAAMTPTHRRHARPGAAQLGGVRERRRDATSRSRTCRSASSAAATATPRIGVAIGDADPRPARAAPTRLLRRRCPARSRLPARGRP